MLCNAKFKLLTPPEECPPLVAKVGNAPLADVASLRQMIFDVVLLLSWGKDNGAQFMGTEILPYPARTTRLLLYMSRKNHSANHDQAYLQ